MADELDAEEPPSWPGWWIAKNVMRKLGTLNSGRYLWTDDEAEGPGPADPAWDYFATAARRFMARPAARRVTCHHATMAQDLAALDVDADDDPRLLNVAEIYADDPQLVACCWRCHEARPPFLPNEDRYPMACPSCGRSDMAELRWRVMHLLRLNVKAVEADTRKQVVLRGVDLSAPICETCWPS